jgi:release factor glutamine methyltransferase
MGPCVRRDDVESVARRMTDFAGQTVEAARRALATRLNTAAIESAELDARILTGHALGLDLTGLISAAQRLLTPDESTRLEEFARRRLAGEPVARITGEKEFWGLPLQLSSATLVPRPDTETVIELALELLRAGGSFDRPLRIADLGTGSGAILLALLSELPAAQGFGTDISEAALHTASVNAARAGLSERATFVACDYASGLTGPFDLIVSNPPYIRTADIGGLAAEVRDHDPPAALDGGADGLDAYRALIPQAAGLLAPGAALVVEAGEGQRAQIQALMTAAGLMPVAAPKADLAGIPRAVAGHKMAR